MKTIQGNLLYLAESGEFDVIIQGCNCFCTMGSGLAKQIKDCYPDAYLVDCTETKVGDRNKLGTYTTACVGEPNKFHIVNAYTQYNFNVRGGDFEDLFEYTAFQLILEKLAFGFSDRPTRFGFPMIGCGLAGGDSKLILAMIEEFSKRVSRKGSTVTVVEYN